MALFGKKKEKAHCPICDKEMGFFSSLMVADGEICGDCEQMIRGSFNVEEYWKRKWGTDGRHRQDYQLKTFDPLKIMTVEQIKFMVNEKKEQQAEVVDAFDGNYANLARIESTFTIAPKALEVGLKRAKQLKGRVVATSIVSAGEIKRGDEVVLISGTGEVETTVLDVIKCSNSSTFETELSANLGKHKAEAGNSAWIFLDITVEPAPGTVIGVK